MENKSPLHFLSLIVPVYKNENSIVRNLHRIKKVLDKVRYDYEIITVIDGMIDQSFQNIKKAKLDKVSCLAYEENHGKSFAIRLGMSKAKGDYIMFMDSGFEIDPNGISMLLEHMEWYDADIIVGSKRHPASFVHYSPIRKVLSYGYYIFVRVLFGISVHDTQAGIKIFRKTVLEKILPRLVEKKFAGDLEMLVAAKQSGFKRIFEAPIKLDYRLGEITQAATIQAIYRIFMDTLAIYYRANFLHYYKQAHTKFSPPESIKIID